MNLSLIIFFSSAGISMVLTSSTKDKNGTDVETLETVDFGEINSNNKSVEAQRKRDSGYTYNKPFRSHRPRSHFGYRGRFPKYPNRINRPFNQYGPPNFNQDQNDLNQHRPHNQHNQPNQTPFDNSQNQGNPTNDQDSPEPSPIASQNDVPFRIGSANYLPPKNQKLPAHSTSNIFSTSQQGSIQGHQHQQLNSQNFVQGDSQDQRISDAALFLTQNAQTLSQLYGAPAPNQEYAPNDEYLNQTPDHQQNFENNLNSQTENIQGSQSSQGFPGPLPSYASGILDSQETLQSIQSFEKDRLIAQLQQALVNQAQFQNLEASGRNVPPQGNVQHQAGGGPGNPGGPQLVSPSVFGGEQSAFGHVPFLSGSAISPPGFGQGYGPPTSGQAPTTPPTTPQPQGPVGGASSPPGSVTLGSFPSSFAPGFPSYGTYIPTLIPGTNFVANVPAFGTGFLGPSAVPNHPDNSPPTQFGIPVSIFPGQKPASGTPTLTISPAPPGGPGVQYSGPGNPHPDPVKPVHPVNNPVHPVNTPAHPVNTPVHPVSYPVHPVLNPAHPVANPVLPIRPVTAPAYTAVTPVHPTYGVQPSFVNSLFLKPLKPVFPVYFYPNGAFQVQKPAPTTQAWNYAPTFQQGRNWK